MTQDAIKAFKANNSDAFFKEVLKEMTSKEGAINIIKEVCDLAVEEYSKNLKRNEILHKIPSS